MSLFRKPKSGTVRIKKQKAEKPDSLGIDISHIRTFGMDDEELLGELTSITSDSSVIDKALTRLRSSEEKSNESKKVN
jgi:hypothetical protein